MNNAVHSFLKHHQVSVVALSMGLLCFAVSLTPSLIPRSAAMQSLLGGIAFAMGYFLSVILLIWSPKEAERLRAVFR